MPATVYSRKNQTVQTVKLRRCLNSLLELSGMKDAHLEVSLVGETRIRQLNRRFLRRDRVTDVISFPLELWPTFGDVPWHLGEIFIATPVARRQAKIAGRNLTAQIIRLAVHGLVHLQGLDHEKGARAQKKFETKERRFLNHLHKKGLSSWDGLLQF